MLTTVPRFGLGPEQWPTLNGSLPLTFTPGCSQWLAGHLALVPVAAACNHAFVIPSVVHRAAVLVDNRLPPRPVKTLSLGLRCDTERKASISLGVGRHHAKPAAFPLRTVTDGWAPAHT